ncbi:unnamed protein product [Closterium sp. NIES-53]
MDNLASWNQNKRAEGRSICENERGRAASAAAPSFAAHIAPRPTPPLPQRSFFPKFPPLPPPPPVSPHGAHIFRQRPPQSPHVRLPRPPPFRLPPLHPRVPRHRAIPAAVPVVFPAVFPAVFPPLLPKLPLQRPLPPSLPAP